MTDADALLLRPGDRIRLIPRAGTGLMHRAMFTVRRVEQEEDVRIISYEGFAFVPWEVEQVKRERQR